METTDKQEVRKKFAQQLRVLRIRSGFKTARSLAIALDIDENRYTRYERGEVEPSLDLLLRLCAKLQVAPNDLFGWDHTAAQLAA